MNPVALLAAEALRRGIAVELTARGSSMRPLLYDGDRLSVAPARASELRTDDLAVALRDGSLLIHRVIALAPLTLRGDARAEADAGVDEVIGTVRAFTRRGVTVRLDAGAGRCWSRLCRAAARAWMNLAASRCWLRPRPCRRRS